MMSEFPHSRKYLSELLLLVVVLVWGSNYPLAKYAISGFDPFVFNGIRYSVATVTVAMLFFARSSWQKIERVDRANILGVGVVGSILYQIAFILGLSMTTAGNSAVLMSTSPLWTIVFNARLHKEKIRVMTFVGMIISLCGVMMIIIGSGKKLQLGSNELFGDLITLAASALWALNTNLQKPLLSKYSTGQVTLMLLGVGAVGLSIIAAPLAVNIAWSSVHWTYYLATVASGALSIGVANLFWSNGVKRLGPSSTANFSNLVPVVAFIISYIAFREHLLQIQFIGAAVTILGVWIARK